MSEFDQKNKTKYYYYDYYNGHIAREKVGNSECASNRFEFYDNGEWINHYDLSLNLSDATMDFGDYSVFDYEEMTEDAAMRRVAAIDEKNKSVRKGER